MLIVAALSLSLNAAAVPLPVKAASGADARIGTPAGSRVCCCGTPDGRCCGKGCCKSVPSPQEQKTPWAPRQDDERAAIGSLAVTGNGLDIPKQLALHYASLSAVAVSGIRTLVALHVQKNC
ncbi:MAG: hypothetical protein AB7Q45_05865 [Planctomycetaceae bacterium]